MEEIYLNIFYYSGPIISSLALLFPSWGYIASQNNKVILSIIALITLSGSIFLCAYFWLYSYDLTKLITNNINETHVSFVIGVVSSLLLYFSYKLSKKLRDHGNIKIGKNIKNIFYISALNGFAICAIPIIYLMLLFRGVSWAS